MTHANLDHFVRWTQRLGVTPTSAEFYPEVLTWLRGRVAATPQRYREALDRILRLLACVREAVPLEVLVAAGVAPLVSAGAPQFAIQVAGGANWLRDPENAWNPAYYRCRGISKECV